jgi:hypothetical protein
VISEARSFAAGMGHPRALEVVSRPGVRAWLIVVIGNLVCAACSHPYGTPTITGHSATETWAPGAGSGSLSVTEHPPALRAGVAVTPVPLLTRVLVTYPLPWRRTRAAAVHQCRGHALCTPVHGPPGIWFADIHRNLSCGTAPEGDYRHPVAACRALTALDAASHRKPRLACACPMILAKTPSWAVRGTIHGARVNLALDPCSLCDMGAGAQRAGSLLTPR